jgi:hypothetical protein
LIQGNTAGADGGGVWLADGFVADLDHVAMINNSANAGAGGALAGNQVDASFTNVTIHGNEAALGGGLYLEGGVPTFENVTVSGNQSWGTGGGLYLLGCSATLTNVLITGNYADDPAGGFGGAIENGAGVSRYDMGTSYAAGSPSLSHCAAWNNHSPYEGAFNNYGGMDDPTGQAGNLAVDPILVPTSWQQPYHLDLGSPLVDAGDATILDPDGTLSDIGAFGGPRADAWDLDRDGYPSWWQPGAYDFTVYPSEGLDCDDLDADIHPGANEIADDGVDSDCDGI